MCAVEVMNMIHIEGIATFLEPHNLFSSYRGLANFREHNMQCIMGFYHPTHIYVDRLNPDELPNT